MQLFYLFNGWAGRNAWLDAAMRFFYVGAVPLLATVLVALLLFRPTAHIATTSNPQAFQTAPPVAWRVALATALGTLLCLLSMAAIDAFAQRWLHTDMLSPRPFVTHWVNSLVVEPNDNSFPSPEIMLAACFATAIWAIFPRGAGVACGIVGLLGFARVFCGTNYPVDVAAGAVLGWAWSAMALALCRVRLPLPAREGRILVWRARKQAFFAASAVAAVALLVGIDLSRTPRYALQMQTLWSAPWNLSPVTAAATSTAMAGAESDTRKAATPPSTHEGEGVAMAPESDVAAPAVRFAGHYGRQAAAESHLFKVLSLLRLPHTLIDIEVAQVRPGNTAYRAAMVRFEAQIGRAEERRHVAQTAMALTRTLFHADATIQNVDVLAVVKRPPIAPTTIGLNDNRLSDSGLSNSASTSASSPGDTAPDWTWTPVFTASVQRRNLRIINGPQWANASGVDAGLWLRARSRLYIDRKTLPASTPAPTVAPPLPTPVPAPTAPPVATATPVATTFPTATKPKRRVSPIVPSAPQSTLRRSNTRVPKLKVRPGTQKSATLRRSSRTLRRRSRTRGYRSTRGYRTRRLRRQY